MTANPQKDMKTAGMSLDIAVVCARPARACEGSQRGFYLPKDARARINRFAHKAAERHGEMVRNQIFASIGALADEGKSLPELIAALTKMLNAPQRYQDGGSNRSKSAGAAAPQERT